MISKLLLQTNNDIPFVEGQITIHNPTISEIAMMGEKEFLIGCQFLNMSKNMLSQEDKKDLDSISDFDIFIAIMSKQEQKIEYRDNVKMLFTLLFPSHQLKITPNELLFANEHGIARIDSTNFTIFQDIIKEMFVLEDFAASYTGYNPVDKRAEKIAEKLMKAKKRKQAEEEEKEVSIFDTYISILSVGLQKDKNLLTKYTVYQLKDEFNRYIAKVNYDMYLEAKKAGATDLEEVDNWMNTIHS